ncbi:MAG: GlsB/YeaQ/YmgE family stress response membrane protein [Dermatophilaceae bacterium]
MSVSGIIGAIIVGLIVGLLGRALVPGKQNISLLVTTIIGVIASFLATWLLGVLFKYDNASGGIPWIGLLGGAIVAAIGIVVYGNMAGKKV